MKLSNHYHQLGEAFSQEANPTPVSEPVLLLWNSPLAESLSLEFSLSDDAELLAQYFSGSRLIDGSKPIAQAYSGHQFGYFNHQLGDGRAHLLGDIKDRSGQCWDVQLKGSGTSNFSRSGDGRCALGPALREFIMSEAMHALGVPTTRCLSVVVTGEAVYREQPLPGAVVTRIASSHIRVGTFQYFAARKDFEAIKKLTVFAINRHFPEIEIHKTSDENSNEIALNSQQVVDFFAAILNKQVKLVVSWLRVGFIHGVMNTDNSAISGETIDYGPCAMMNHYHSDTVFSSIDRNGRYAFGNQSKIMQWNMARLADCLLPIIDEDEAVAMAKIEPLLRQFANDLQYGYFAMMANKLGITELSEGDVELINDLLALMQESKADYTQFFVTLKGHLTQIKLNEFFIEIGIVEQEIQEKWQAWLTRWYERVVADLISAEVLMAKNNPLVIPRNHHVEHILATCQTTGNLSPLLDFLTVLQQPYTQLDETKHYQDKPSDDDENYHTFCGT